MAEIEITTQVGCRNQCSYCPQDKFVNSYSKFSDIKEMSFETFKRCVDKVPKKVTIVFSGFSEPFLNPECTKMIHYANKKRHTTVVHTTCMGMKISDIDVLKKIKFDRFCIHLPDDNNQTKIKIDENYFNILNKLIESRMQIVFLLNILPDGNKNMHPKLEKFLLENESKITIIKSRINNRAGNVSDKIIPPIKKRRGRLFRCWRLKCNVLFPNGDVCLCAMDWSIKHRLGNLINSNYKSIYKNKEYARVLKGLKDNNSDILCRYCEIYDTYYGKENLISYYSKKIKRILSLLIR